MEQKFSYPPLTGVLVYWYNIGFIDLSFGSVFTKAIKFLRHMYLNAVCFQYKIGICKNSLFRSVVHIYCGSTFWDSKEKLATPHIGTSD